MQPPQSTFREWDFVRDNKGVVWCLGLKQSENVFEAVAAYLHVDSTDATKLHLLDDLGYRRIMYHGLPEETEKLAILPAEIRSHLVSTISGEDSQLRINTSSYRVLDRRFADPAYWMKLHDDLAAPFVSSLDIALATITDFGISTDKIRLYGGAAFGLVNRQLKHVDDVDLLLEVRTDTLKQLLERFQTPFAWDELDPEHVLSQRRLLLKAKRWSTSQIRLGEEKPLTIDLKIPRKAGERGLWSSVDVTAKGGRYSGSVTVTDDSEAFHMSPALRGTDETGQEVTILMQGYSYIGCALNNDVIQVKGTKLGDGQFILVAQRSEDLITPDLRKVPVSN